MPSTPPQSPKRSKKHYSPHKRTRISTSFLTALTAPEVAEKERIPVTSVYGINARYRVQKSGQSRPRSGRPPKLTTHDKTHIRRLIEGDPFVSPKELADGIENTASPLTITRWLRREGILHFKALRRPALTEAAAAKRLEWCLQHRGKPLSFWRKWIFLDEVTAARGDGDRTGWVFCRRVSYLPLTLTLAHARLGRANGIPSRTAKA